MKLSNPQRRLLKMAARVEPGEVAITPMEEKPAKELVEMGLLEAVTLYAGKRAAVKITDAGSEQARKS